MDQLVIYVPVHEPLFFTRLVSDALICFQYCEMNIVHIQWVEKLHIWRVKVGWS